MCMYVCASIWCSAMRVGRRCIERLDVCMCEVRSVFVLRRENQLFFAFLAWSIP